MWGIEAFDFLGKFSIKFPTVGKISIGQISHHFEIAINTILIKAIWFKWL
jgi:hypothetical protein